MPVGEATSRRKFSANSSLTEQGRLVLGGDRTVTGRVRDIK